MDSNIIPYLFLVTFLIALVFGVIQWNKAKKARREHHHSVGGKTEPEANRSSAGGAPPQR